ncbi:hypothetical protein GY45DRAFT_1253758 [Cubamyces sp. BRFM 1775]|nr:hypothetical protein GY45DRAFT_1253758 [Cubamyces sp. BRFM 1775]
MNLDVLRLILICLANEDLLTMTCVSRGLQDEAYNELLMRPIHLDGNTRLLSFIRFVFPRNIHRLSSMRALILRNIGVLLQPDIDKLVSIFQACTTLRSLHCQLSDDLLENYRVVEAIVSLTTLTELNIWLQRDSELKLAIAWNIALHTPSRLKQLRLPLVPPKRVTTTPVRDLANAQPGLEDLMLNVYSFADPGVAYQALRTLSLIVEDTLPNLQDLERAFPNVRKLIFSHYMLLDVGDALPQGHLHGDPSSTRDSTGWKSLDYLFATPASIRVVGITCPVKHLNLGFYEVTLHREIANIVGFLRPRKLTLNVFCDAATNSGWELPHAEPSVTLHNPSTTWVKHLYLQTGYNMMSVPSTADFLAALSPLVSSSRVELLHISIGPFFVSDNPEEVVHPPIPMADDIPEKVKHVDVQELARGLAQTCPSVQTVAISVVMTDHYVWSIQRVDDRMEVVKLSSFEGRVRLDSEATRLETTSSSESDWARVRM